MPENSVTELLDFCFDVILTHEEDKLSEIHKSKKNYKLHKQYDLCARLQYANALYGHLITNWTNLI